MFCPIIMSVILSMTLFITVIKSQNMDIDLFQICERQKVCQVGPLDTTELSQTTECIRLSNDLKETG